MGQVGTIRTVRSPADVLDEHLLELPEPPWDLLPAAVYGCDQDGLILRYNRPAAEPRGRAPTSGEPEERFGGPLRMYASTADRFHPTNSRRVEVLRTRPSVRNRGVVLERLGGSRRGPGRYSCPLGPRRARSVAFIQKGTQRLVHVG